MENEQQLIGLEYARKLEKLGVKQVSIWYWRKHKDISSAGIGWRLELRFSTPDSLIEESYSAFTVAELGEMLPQHWKDNNGYMLTIVKDENNDWFIGYMNADGIGIGNISFTEKNFANAMAKLKIYLLENNLTK